MGEVVEEFQLGVTSKGFVGEEAGSLLFGEAVDGSLGGGSGHRWRWGVGSTPKSGLFLLCVTPLQYKICSDSSKKLGGKKVIVILILILIKI